MKEYFKKLEELKEKEYKRLIEYRNILLNELNEQLFISFDINDPYIGEKKNMIFFVYSDHYKYNSPVSMSVNCLKHPNYRFEDRGYIKGVATDLTGYLKLREANNLNFNINPLFNLYRPKLKKSKNIEEKMKLIQYEENKVLKFLDIVLDDAKIMLNQFLKDKTDCSLLYYVEQI